MTYAVAGVSGHTGRVAAQALLDAGQKVRVIVRDAAKGAEWAAKGAEVAVADVGDATALSAALRGAASAYLLLPPNMSTGDFRAYQKRTGEALLDGVKRSGISQVVLLSSIGAQHASGTGPIAGLHPIENGLKALGVGVTSIRAAYFIENIGGSLGMLDQGLLPSFTPTDLAFEMVATRDIGLVAAKALREGAKGFEAIELSAAKKYSMDDAAEVLSQLTGRAVKAQQFPLEAMVPTLTGFGVPADIAELYREMTAGIISGHVAFEGGHRRVHGETDLATVLRGALGR